MKAKLLYHIDYVLLIGMALLFGIICGLVLTNGTSSALSLSKPSQSLHVAHRQHQQQVLVYQIQGGETHAQTDPIANTIQPASVQLQADAESGDNTQTVLGYNAVTWEMN